MSTLCIQQLWTNEVCQINLDFDIIWMVLFCLFCSHSVFLQVSIFFDSVLLRGNRSTKVDNGSFDAFASPNMEPLAVVGVSIKGLQRMFSNSQKAADWKILIGIFAFYPRDIMQAWVLAMALCPCLPQVGVLSKWMDRIIWLLAWGLLSTSPTPCFKEIQVSTKTTVLPSGTFFQTPHTENFASAYRSSNVLSAWLKKGGCSQRDKLDRRQSAELTISL